MNSTIPTRQGKPSLIREVMQNKSIRLKFVLSILVISAIATLGYHDGQLRPAFPDLMEITNVDLEKGSSIITSYFSGRLVGAGLGGILHFKMNIYVMFVLSLAIDSGVVAAIPWCSVYELMVTAHALHGILLSVVNVAVTTTSMQLWGATSRGRSYVQISYMFFDIFLTLAPIVTAPFLHEKEDNGNLNNATGINSIPLHTGTRWSGNDSYINDTAIHSDSQQTAGLDSTLYVAYSISAGLTMIVSIPFMILYLTTSVTDSRRKQENETVNFLGNLSPIANYLQFINIGVFVGFYNVIHACYPQYLTVFCVQHLNWTKMSGALITSVLSFSGIGGRLAGVFLLRAMKSHTTLLLACVLITAGFGCLTLSAYIYADIGVWISACITGIAISIIWPSTLSWVNSYLIPVGGKVSSYLIVISYVCVLFTPTILGYLMQEVSLLWFCYSCLIASAINVTNVVFIVIHTIYFERKRHSYTVEVYTVDQPDQMECQTEVSRL